MSRWPERSHGRFTRLASNRYFGASAASLWLIAEQSRVAPCTRFCGLFRWMVSARCGSGKETDQIDTNHHDQRYGHQLKLQTDPAMGSVMGPEAIFGGCR